jgi:hypothetical protein
MTYATRRNHRRTLPQLELLENRTLPSTFGVVNTDDSGAGSLRQAILDANDATGSSEITFNIPGSVLTIVPQTNLPALGNSITLDATTQPGFEGTPLIILSGANLSSGAGISMGGNGDTVRGFSFTDFGTVQNGGLPFFVSIPVEIDGNNNILSGNNIIGNAGASEGIDVTGSSNVIGGTTAADRNVISGNMIGAYLSGGSDNIVEGNYIGTDVTGTQADGDISDGIRISALSMNDTIGGTTAGAGNVISGNNGGAANGIEVDSSTGDLIEGNLIGTDASGTKALGNADSGITLIDSANCTVGGITSAARNVVSANGAKNISVVTAEGTTAPSTSDIIEGNFIGTQGDGQSPFDAADVGILILTSGNTVSGNTIAYNGVANVGTTIGGPAVNVLRGVDNRISQNSMFDNGTIGIQLGSDVYTPNGVNPGAGPNNSQNFPEITSAMSSNGQTVIQGTLSSQANTQYTLEFFAAPSQDSGGYVEGKTFLGTLSVTTDAGGSASFNFTGTADAGPFYTATATDPSGNTSAFWQPDRPAPTITSVTTDSIRLGAIENADLVTLTVTGTNFFTTTAIETSGSAIAPLSASTTFVSDTQLQVVVEVQGIGQAATITANNPGPAGGPSNADDYMETNGQHIVAAIYQNLLGRVVDASGLKYWSAQIDQGIPGFQVVGGIEESMEYRGIQVRNLYQQYLHRGPDSAGLANDIAMLQNGTTVEQLAATIMGSDEFFELQGGSTNNGFLAAVYQDALNRPIDAAGQASWLDALANHATREEVAFAIVNSLEYRQDLVQSYYTQFLNRQADTAGLNDWVQQLTQGARDEYVIAQILGSTEYFNNPFV